MLKILTAAAFAGTLLILVYAATGPPPGNSNRLVRFTNETREPIIELHVSPVGGGDWQSDLLGWDYLPPGHSVLLDIVGRDGSCRVNVKIVLDDGSERVSRGVDVCRSLSWAVALR